MSSNQYREIRATGGSMGPFILSGSRLLVRQPRARDIAVGDVVGYLNETGAAVVHRVTKKKTTRTGNLLFVRGDAQHCEEQIPEEAVTFVVHRVEHPLLSYDTGSPFGKAIAAVALGRSLPARWTRLFLRQAWKSLGRTRRLLRLS